MTNDNDVAEINHLLIDNAHLRAELAGVRRDLAQQQRALAAERAARAMAEADTGWWHSTVANYVMSANVNDRELLRFALGDALTVLHPGASLLAELAAARDLSRMVGEQNTTIGYQDAMLAQLRAALAPFAIWARRALDQAQHRDTPLRDDDKVFRLDDTVITIGDLRRAVAATNP